MLMQAPRAAMPSSESAARALIDAEACSAVGWMLRGICASYLRSRIAAVEPPRYHLASHLARIHRRARGAASRAGMAEANHPADNCNGAGAGVAHRRPL